MAISQAASMRPLGVAHFYHAFSINQELDEGPNFREAALRAFDLPEAAINEDRQVVMPWANQIIPAAGTAHDVPAEEDDAASVTSVASSGAPPRRKARDSNSDASQPSEVEGQADNATVVEVFTDEDESEPQSEEEFELSEKEQRLLHEAYDTFATSGERMPAMVIDTASGRIAIYCGQVSDALKGHWLKEVGDHLICQLELYVMVSLRWSLKNLLHNRRTIWWVDNEAARFSLIKGQSGSESMNKLVRQYFHIDGDCPTYAWIERVPSFSNPADAPSRFKPELAREWFPSDQIGGLGADLLTTSQLCCHLLILRDNMAC